MKKRIYLTVFLVAFVFTGCAPKEVPIKKDIAKTVQIIGILTNSKSDRIEFIDLAGTRKDVYQQNFGGGQFGAIGGALEALVHEAEIYVKDRELMGGSIGALRESLSGFQADDIFKQIMVREIEGYEKKSNILKLVVLNENERNNLQDLDAILEINYVYGIGAYVPEVLNAVISANIVLTRTTNGETLANFDHVISAGTKSPCTLKDYAINNGALYKTDFSEAAKGFTISLAEMLAYN